MVTEKRKERRIRANLPIKMLYNNNIEVISRTENISLLGTYVEIDREIPVGTGLKVILYIPKYTPDLSLNAEVNCKGNVFRCNLARELGSKQYYGIGIFFMSFLNKIDRDKLSKYIDFLILNENQNIREGLKQWKEKRATTRKTKQAKKTQIKQEEFQTETLELLKQILVRLEEISLQIKSQCPSSNS